MVRLSCIDRSKEEAMLMLKSVLHPGILDREWPSTRSKHLYFNINYMCNSHCVFCASDIKILEEREIDLLTFTSLLELNDVSPNDYIIINGGEPTLSDHLTDVLATVNAKGAHCHLFTNGRKLSNNDYCRDIINTGVSRISIPIYATNPEEHDRLTGSTDSFRQTVSGIHNILELREVLSRDVTLELKLLFFRPTRNTNQRILKWIIQEFPTVDSISLNSLIVSRTVIQHWDELGPTPYELKKSSNATLDTARAMGIQHKIRVNDLPHCLIEKRNWGFLPPPSRESEQARMFAKYQFFDPLCMGGRKGSEQKTLMPEFCDSCLYRNRCVFINSLHFDDFVATQSINAVFPNAVLVASSIP